MATRELKEQLAEASGKRKNKRKGGRLGDEGDEGVEQIIGDELKRGYAGSKTMKKKQKRR